MSAKKTVLVFGGGVGGLSAAHELTEGPRANHFDVTVIEPAAFFGGKAMSEDIKGDPAAQSGKPYPGEHGFRFFPTFYRHVTDTMSRIPSGCGGLGRVSVADHLVETSKRMLARRNKPPLTFPPAPSLAQPLTLMPFLQAIGGVDIAGWEYAFFIAKLLQLAITPKADRLANQQTQSWWDYVRLRDGVHSADYEHYLAGGLTRTLVAAKPTEINAKTGGDVLLRMLVDSGINIGLGSGLAPGLRAARDRILDGPTTQVWIDPWVAELKRRGVKFEPGALHSLQLDPLAKTPRVGGAKVAAGGQLGDRSADYYVAALPAERMAEVLQRSSEVEAAGENLAGIRTHLHGDVRFMTGMQFFLKQPLANVDRDMGHVIYADSEWALTGICQSHFWRAPFDDLTKYGDDDALVTVWSTILSDWETPFGGKAAKVCSRAELLAHTVTQLEQSLNHGGTTRFDKTTVIAHHLDSALTAGPDAGGDATNTQPLLVNKPGRWQQARPEPVPAGLGNLMLAADYVRTNADLATMEAANEAARRAVNGILADAGVGPRCEVFELYFPEVLGHHAAELVGRVEAFEAQLLAEFPPPVI